jgi:hypothetical protein
VNGGPGSGTNRLGSIIVHDFGAEAWIRNIENLEQQQFNNSYERPCSAQVPGHAPVLRNHPIIHHTPHATRPSPTTLSCSSLSLSSHSHLTLLFHTSCDLLLEQIRMQLPSRLVAKPPAHTIPYHAAVLLQDARDESEIGSGEGSVGLEFVDRLRLRMGRRWV